MANHTSRDRSIKLLITGLSEYLWLIIPTAEIIVELTQK